MDIQDAGTHAGKRLERAFERLPDCGPRQKSATPSVQQPRRLRKTAETAASSFLQLLLFSAHLWE
eukprot:15120824-Alexandrium_andersonii.AAC.1